MPRNIRYALQQQDPRLIELVKDMVKANLAPEHHIIAMALPAGQDAETQVG